MMKMFQHLIYMLDGLLQLYDWMGRCNTSRQVLNKSSLAQLYKHLLGIENKDEQ